MALTLVLFYVSDTALMIFTFLSLSICSPDLFLASCLSLFLLFGWLTASLSISLLSIFSPGHKAQGSIFFKAFCWVCRVYPCCFHRQVGDWIRSFRRLLSLRESEQNWLCSVRLRALSNVCQKYSWNLGQVVLKYRCYTIINHSLYTTLYSSGIMGG